jgi:hypothetical protein
MSVNFPNSPEDGDVFSGYIYDATKSVWKKLSDLSSSGIDDLNDVTITSPENGQALIYDTSIQEWINQALVEPVLTLEGLSDTNIEDPLDGQALVYDSASGQWINETPASNLSDLSDVTISTATTDQLLRWNGTAWVNDTAKTNSIADSAVTASKLATTAGAVMVFADAAARTTAIPSPVEGMVTYLSDSDALFSYSGAAWVPAVNTASIVNGNVTTAKLGAGTILQVVSSFYTGQFSSNSATYVNVTGFSASITPRDANSKILVIASMAISNTVGGATGHVRISGGGMGSAIGPASGNRVPSLISNSTTPGAPLSISVLDSPATASPITYQVEARRGSTGSVFFNLHSASADNSDNASSPCTLTLLEVAG